ASGSSLITRRKAPGSWLSKNLSVASMVSSDTFQAGYSPWTVPRAISVEPASQTFSALPKSSSTAKPKCLSDPTMVSPSSLWRSSRLDTDGDMMSSQNVRVLASELAAAIAQNDD